MARAFVIRPFGTKKDTAGKDIDFERVQRELIGPALQATAFSGPPPEKSWSQGNS